MTKLAVIQDPSAASRLWWYGKASSQSGKQQAFTAFLTH